MQVQRGLSFTFKIEFLILDSDGSRRDGQRLLRLGVFIITSFDQGLHLGYQESLSFEDDLGEGPRPHGRELRPS